MALAGYGAAKSLKEKPTVVQSTKIDSEELRTLQLENDELKLKIESLNGSLAALEKKKKQLEDEKDELKERDPDSYRNIWQGECRSSLEGAIYAKEIRQATDDGRIMNVPYDALKPVHTFWDLGWADNTSIWFAQSVGQELRLIDYYANSLEPLQHYISVLQGKGYIYGTDWLPHDAKAKSLSTGKSIEEIMLALGRKVQICANLSLYDGIQAVRSIFGRCYFDETRCAEGLQSLRHYRYEVDKDTGQLSGRPLHDIHSHAADAFRYFAISIAEDTPNMSARGIRIPGWRAA